MDFENLRLAIDKCFEISSSLSETSLPEKDSLEYKFMEGVSLGTYKNKKEACLDIYGIENSKEFNALFRRFIERLCSFYFVSDAFSSDTNTLKEEKKAYKLLYTAKQLYLEGKIELSLAVSKLLCNRCFRLHMYSLGLETSIFMTGALVESGDTSSFYDKQNNVKHFKEMVDVSTEAFLLYSDIKKALLAKHIGEKRTSNIEDCLEGLTSIYKASCSPVVYSFYHKAALSYYDIKRDFDTVLEICLETKLRFKSNDRINFRLNDYYTLYAYLVKKLYSKGLSLIDSYLGAFEEKSMNYFVVAEIHILYLLHTRDYDTASRKCAHYMNLPEFSGIFKPALERWQMYQDYIAILLGSSEYVYMNPVHYRKESSTRHFSYLCLSYVKVVLDDSISNKREILRPIYDSLTTYVDQKEEYKERDSFFARFLVDFYDKEFSSYEDVNRLSLEKTSNTSGLLTETEMVKYEDLIEVLLKKK